MKRAKIKVFLPNQEIKTYSGQLVGEEDSIYILKLNDGVVVKLPKACSILEVTGDDSQ